VVAKLIKLIANYSKRHTRDMLAAQETDFREFVDELRDALPRVLKRLGTVEPRIQRLEDLMNDRLDDPQFARFLNNRGLEGAREELNERRRMLAHAAAGGFDVTMTMAQIARAARTLRELDPRDIEALRSLNTGERHADSDTSDVETLLAAGCVWPRTHSPVLGGEPTTSYSRTQNGELVLQLLRTYEPAREE
jgi:hypothetical protein